MRKRDGFLAALACLLWSTAFVGIKTGFAAGAEPFFFAGIRFFISGLILIPIVLVIDGRKRFLSDIRNHGGFIFAIGILQTSLLYGVFYIALRMIPASIAAIIIGAQPLLTSAAAHALPPGERLNRRQWFSLFLGIIGLVIISLSRSSFGGEHSLTAEITGILILLIALTSSSFSTLWVSRTSRDISPIVLSSGQFLIGGGILLIASRIVEGPPSIAPGPSFYISLVWLVIVSSTAVTIWFQLLRKSGSGAGALSVWKFIIPVTGAVLGWLLIPGDSPDGGSVTGMLMIAISVLIYFLSGARKLK